MASIARHLNGRRDVQVVGIDQKRRTIRPGEVDQRTADDSRLRIGELNAAEILRLRLTRRQQQLQDSGDTHRLNEEIVMAKNLSEIASSQPPQLVTLAMIRRHYVPIAARTLFRMISSGQFPKADIGIGGKIRLWKRETVEAWIASKACP